MRQHPPAQSTGSCGWRPPRPRRRTTRIRFPEVNSKLRQRLEALLHPPHLPPQAPASPPPASPAALVRVRGARGHALASARGAWPGRARMRAAGGRGRAASRRRRPRALRAEAVWVEAASEAAAPQSRGDARASRSGNGRFRSGRGGPGGTARPRRCVPRGRRSLPGPGVAAAPGDAPWHGPKARRRGRPHRSDPGGRVRGGAGRGPAPGQVQPPGPASEVSTAPLGPSEPRGPRAPLRGRSPVPAPPSSGSARRERPGPRARAGEDAPQTLPFIVPSSLSARDSAGQEKCPSLISVRSSSWGARRRRSSTNTWRETWTPKSFGRL